MAHGMAFHDWLSPPLVLERRSCHNHLALLSRCRDSEASQKITSGIKTKAPSILLCIYRIGLVFIPHRMRISGWCPSRTAKRGLTFWQDLFHSTYYRKSALVPIAVVLFLLRAHSSQVGAHPGFHTSGLTCNFGRYPKIVLPPWYHKSYALSIQFSVLKSPKNNPNIERSKRGIYKSTYLFTYLH